ncbi:hypothetical protein [Nonomuraea dietziae]|uniref:hypothetical protein n=1 Tax=Nonomuraea dietziae TaxID=65515 RepID=UPI003413B1E1
MPDVRVTGADQFARLARELKKTDKKLAAELRKTIRAATRPAVTSAKAAITALPVKGSRGGGSKARAEQHLSRVKDPANEKAITRAQARAGLRKTIAASIKADIRDGGRRAGVRIIVDANKLPPDQRKLPRYLNTKTGWRHPLFGNRERWYGQRGMPWFEPSIKPHARRIRKSILATMKKMAADLERKE